MDKRTSAPDTLARIAAAILVIGLATIACSGPQPTDSPLTVNRPSLGQSGIPTPTPRPVLDPSATPSPTPGTAALQFAPDFTLPQADGPAFSLAEQLAQGPVVIAFFQRGGG